MFKRIRKIISSPLTVGLLAGVLIMLGSSNVSAAPVVGFNPGNIISDNIFTNYQTMNASQVQQFLDSKVPSCDTNGTKPASEFGRSDLTHAQYAASRGWAAPPYTCLKDYVEGGKSAAQIIVSTAQAHQINPQVLIVLLQKEQSLVTDTWPLPGQYRTATGYACPDNGSCDSQYFGLTNQLTWAAKMFRAIMNASPTWYTPYVVGNNYIQYNPNASCGGTTVNIINRATQALYNYTPYQPNQSALNAGYGMGDSCGAYGNRNFYLYFSDWFGSPQYGNLVRTTGNATVYLVAGDNKYPIDNMTTLTNFTNTLGPVGFGTDSYLASKTTGRTATNLIKPENSSTLYFTNAGIKLPFTSCTVAAHYARPCGSEIVLSEGQAALFATGPNMTRLYQTTTGMKYYIESGNKREVYDTQSLTDAGISGDFLRLLDTGIAHLGTGTPVVRDDVIATSRSGGGTYFIQAGKAWRLSPELEKTRAFSALSKEELGQDAIDALSTQGELKGFVRNSSGNKYVLDANGKTLLTDPNEWTTSFTQLDDTFVAGIPNSSQPTNDRFVKIDGEGTIYYVTGGKKYYIASWGDFLRLHADGSDTLSVLPASAMSVIPAVGNIYAPGSLVKSPTSATVYVVNSILEKTPMSSLQFADDHGLSGIRTVPQSALDAMQSTDANLGSFAQCGGKTYLANKGWLYEIDTTAASRFGFSSITATDWDSAGCDNLNIATEPLSQYSFIKIENGKTLYMVQNGEKRPIASMAKYASLGGSSSTLLVVSSRVGQLLPEGALLY